MIPVQQVKGLNVADLPARATQVTPEALTLGGAYQVVGNIVLRRSSYPNRPARVAACSQNCLSSYNAPASTRRWGGPTTFVCTCYR